MAPLVNTSDTGDVGITWSAQQVNPATPPGTAYADAQTHPQHAVQIKFNRSDLPVPQPPGVTYPTF